MSQHRCCYFCGKFVTLTLIGVYRVHGPRNDRCYGSGWVPETLRTRELLRLTKLAETDPEEAKRQARMRKLEKALSLPRLEEASNG